MKKKSQRSCKQVNQLQVRVDSRNEHFKQVLSHLRDTAKVCGCPIRIVMDCSTHLLVLMVASDGVVDYVGQKPKFTKRETQSHDDKVRDRALQCDDVLDKFGDVPDVKSSEEAVLDDSDSE